MFAIGWVYLKLTNYWKLFNDTGFLVRSSGGSYYLLSDGVIEKTVVRAVFQRPVKLIQNTASQADDQTSPASGQSQVPVKKKRLGCLRVLSLGCLAVVLLIAGGLAIILIPGALGLRGDGDSSPAWSPDGSRIAFVANRDGASDIYVMNPDGTEVVQLTGK